MKCKTGKLYFQFSVPDTAAVCMLLCLNRWDIYLTAVICSALHECGHLFAMRLCEKKISSVTVYPFGVKIQPFAAQKSSYNEDIFIALSGPAVNAAIAAVCKIAQQTSTQPTLQYIFYINLSLCLLNLLPAKPLDGARILSGALLKRFDMERSGFLCEKAAFYSIILLEILFIIITAYSKLNISVVAFEILLLYYLLRES